MSADEDAILARRAAELAKPRAVDRAEADVAFEVVVCRVAEERWGVPLTALSRIAEASPVTAVPGQPAAVLGVTYAFGQLAAFVSGRRLLAERPARAAEPWAVGLETSAGPLVLGVDEVLGSRRILAGDLDLTYRPRADGLALARTADHLAVIDLAAVCADPRVVLGGRHEL